MPALLLCINIRFFYQFYFFLRASFLHNFFVSKSASQLIFFHSRKNFPNALCSNNHR